MHKHGITISCSILKHRWAHYDAPAAGKTKEHYNYVWNCTKTLIIHNKTFQLRRTEYLYWQGPHSSREHVKLYTF